MNQEMLQIFTNDHLGLISAELELIERVRQELDDPDWLQAYAAEVRDQRDELSRLMELMGFKEDVVKQAAGWLAEKVGRLKLNGRVLTQSPLSRLVEYEGMALAAKSREVLWGALQSAMGDDARGHEIDLRRLRNAAEDHLHLMDDAIQRAAQSALRTAAASRA